MMIRVVGSHIARCENTRYNMGWMLDLTRRMNLAAMTPQTGTGMCSTSYCLVADGSEYLVYLPSGRTTSSILETFGMQSQDHKRLSSIHLYSDSITTVDLSAAGSKELNVEWFNPADGTIIESGTVQGGGSIFSPCLFLVMLYSIFMIFPCQIQRQQRQIR